MEEEKNEIVTEEKGEIKNNKMEKKRTTIILLIVIVVAIVLSFGCGYVFRDKLVKDDNKDNNNVPVKANELDFDFDAMETALKSKLQNGQFKAVKISCTSTPGPEGELPIITNTGKIISNDSIDTIVNKLKNADSLEKNITSSWIGECMPKSVAYIISVNDKPESNEFQSNKIFTLYYADDTSNILVGYEGIGYSFNYDNSEEINNFIESLK